MKLSLPGPTQLVRGQAPECAFPSFQALLISGRRDHTLRTTGLAGALLQLVIFSGYEWTMTLF